MSSRMGSCQIAGFSSVTEDTASQEDWREGFASVIKRVSNQMDWREVVVEYPV
jgi:hypothetical protein